MIEGMTNVNDSERKLIDLLREESSTKAFARLYDIYAPRLYSFSLKMAKSKEDAEEIVQDAFMWLWQNRASIKPQDTLINLLFLHTRHRLINLYRKNLNSPDFLSYLECLEVADLSNASDDLDMKEVIAQVRSAIDQLPPTQKKVMLMAHHDGMNAKEISQKLNLTEQSVRNQLSLATKKLRKKFGNKVPLSIIIVLIISNSLL